MKNIYGLILAGGSGTRLWPISRDYYPKQFLKLTGDKTLIQQTFLRLKAVIPSKKIFLTTNRIYVDEIVNQLKNYGFQKDNIIIQPTDKNTGPAIAHAAKRIYEKDKLAIIVNCPSDHIIEPIDNFISSLKIAYDLSKSDKLVTLGIKPTSPNTEYGYIFPDISLVTTIKGHKTYKVSRFFEKPNLDKAKLLIKKGSFWNSGIFIWKARVILDEYKHLDNEVYNSLSSSKYYFSLIPSAVDTAILEKSNKVSVVPTDFTWSDIGSWKALYELLNKDGDGNILNKRVVSLDSKNSLVYGIEGRTIVAINLNNLIIIDSKDSVLVADIKNSHQIKKALQIARDRGLDEETKRPLVSIITPVLNEKDFIEDTILSVLSQTYKNIEYIIVDGGSTDGTLSIINKYRYKIENLHLLRTTNTFEMINAGIKEANGEIIGILDTNNTYVNNEVIEYVIKKVNVSRSSIFWGDVIYANNKLDNKITMFWKSSDYKKNLFKTGWHPPFPSLFVRKSTYQKYGLLNSRFKVASDYELMLRLLERKGVKGEYIPQVMVKMTGKGLTVKSIKDRIIGNFEAYKAWGENGLKIKPTFLFSKYYDRMTQLYKKDTL